MRILILLLFLLYSSTTIFSQEKRNIIWFTEKSPTSTYGFQEGQTVPNLSIKDVYKKRVKLHNQLDKLTIIEFRKTDCQACTKNNKILKRFYQQYSINIISIYDDTRFKAVKNYAIKNGLNWTTVQDNAPKNELLKKEIGLMNSPDFIVISPDKKVLKVFKSGKEIGRLGVFLQQYFSNN